MNWWNELVWVGNVLYPRWFVFGVPVSVIVIGIVLFVVIRKVIQWVL